MQDPSHAHDAPTFSPDYFRKPGPARVWNYLLGGRDNYPVDQAAGEEFAQLYPPIRELAKEDRAFLVRVVRYLAGLGVRQFLDVGIGLPTEQNTHEVAQAVQPEAKVVYVDNDPVVLTHAQAWLTNSTKEGSVLCVPGDLRDPESVVASSTALLDLDQPVAVLLLGSLGYAATSPTQLKEILGRLIAALPRGSYLAIGDGVDTGDAGYRRAAGRLGYHLRTPEQLRDCLSGLELLEPGLVPVNAWHPDSAEPRAPIDGYVAVGHIS